MSLLGTFDIAGSAMSAQSLRLNVTASNLANAGTVSGDEASAYRARHPVFETLRSLAFGAGTAGVGVLGITRSNAPVETRFQPDHPLADESGQVYLSNVNPIEELANMISASRSYQTNVEVINTAKDLALRTLSLGR